MAERPSGLVLVDKPRGPTSHDVVRGVRKRFATREVGHAGTLDPMATGLLVVLIGDATRLVPWATGADKTYEAVVQLGVETDSLDAMGAVIREAPVPADVAQRLDDALRAERDRTSQVPPRVSALHVDGERAHDRARRGEAFELPPRDVAVHALSAVVEGTSVRLSVACGKGYYVRSLARDLAERLGTVGHLVALRRTRVGPWAVEHAAEDVLIDTATAMTSMFPCVEVGEDVALLVRHGKRLPWAGLGVGAERVGVELGVLERGRPLAVVRVGEDGARIVRAFPTGTP